MNISTLGVPKAGLPEGFVYIDELIDDAVIDAKYWGTDNLMGVRFDGYERPLVVMSQEAADCCVKAAQILRKQGYFMKIFDAFRPQRAVDHLVRWGSDIDDIRRKTVHYPYVNKADFFDIGYVARKSGHSRGSSVDLTLVDSKSYQELDMGSCFDFMDPRSHIVTDAITAGQERNRRILRDAMTACGFVTYECEWWHFNLKTEPYPDTYFDFPIK